jgi:hypothetical protein
VLGLADVEKDLLGLGTSIDYELDQYFGGQLRSVGYWRSPKLNPAAAGEAALAELFALLTRDEKDALAGGSLLVIGERVAAVAAAIRRQLAVDTCDAIELDRDVPVNSAISIVDGDIVRIRRGAAGRIKASPNTYDAIMWLEAPSRGDRRRALRDAARALKPGGVLLATDLVGTSAAQLTDYLPPETAAGDALARCQRELTAAGFATADVHDVTARGWHAFYQHSREYFLTKLLFQQIDSERYEALLAALPGGQMAIEAHLMIVARKGQA